MLTLPFPLTVVSVTMALASMLMLGGSGSFGRFLVVLAGRTCDSDGHSELIEMEVANRQTPPPDIVPLGPCTKGIVSQEGRELSESFPFMPKVTRYAIAMMRGYQGKSDA